MHPNIKSHFIPPICIFLEFRKPLWMISKAVSMVYTLKTGYKREEKKNFRRKIGKQVV